MGVHAFFVYVVSQARNTSIRSASKQLTTKAKRLCNMEVCILKTLQQSKLQAQESVVAFLICQQRIGWHAMNR